MKYMYISIFFYFFELLTYWLLTLVCLISIRSYLFILDKSTGWQAYSIFFRGLGAFQKPDHPCFNIILFKWTLLWGSDSSSLGFPNLDVPTFLYQCGPFYGQYPLSSLAPLAANAARLGHLLLTRLVNQILQYLLRWVVNFPILTG